MSDRIELSKLKTAKKEQKSVKEGKVHRIDVTGRIPAELDIVILRGKK